MLNRTAFVVAAGLIAAATPQTPTLGQETQPEDEAINAIRSIDTISPSDQRRIGEWVQLQVDNLTATAGQSDTDRLNACRNFRNVFKTQFENNRNSQAFLAQLPAQTAAIAAAPFRQAQADQFVTRSLARVLVDMNRPETLPGLFAGLECRLESVRYLCTRGIINLNNAIAANKEQFDRAVAALRTAALAESNPVVTGHIYKALAFPAAAQVTTVFDVYMAVFDKRLTARREGASADGAEIEAYEFFRTPGVLDALTNIQKSQLVNRVAVFMQLDARRYNTAELKFYEIDAIERLLDGAEAILSNPALLGPSVGGKIRDALSQAGHEGRANVLSQAFLWVGDPQANTPGAANAAPWNVPIGAP